MNKLRLAVCVLSCGSAAFGQQVISARSGLIHYVEGRVTLDGKPVEVKIASFTDMKESSELRSEDGRFFAPPNNPKRRKQFSAPCYSQWTNSGRTSTPAWSATPSPYRRWRSTNAG